MNQKLNSGYKYYNSLRIIIENFFEAKNDIRWLLKIEDYDELPEIPDEDILILQKIYEDIGNEYTAFDTKENDDIILTHKVRTNLIGTQQICSYILQILKFKYISGLNQDWDKLEKILSDYGFPLRYTGPHDYTEALELISHQLGTVEQQIDQKSKYINDRIKQSDGDFDYISLIAKMNLLLPNVKIDIRNDTMKEFIKYKDEFLKIIESQRRNGN